MTCSKSSPAALGDFAGGYRAMIPQVLEVTGMFQGTLLGIVAGGKSLLRRVFADSASARKEGGKAERTGAEGETSPSPGSPLTSTRREAVP